MDLTFKSTVRRFTGMRKAGVFAPTTLNELTLYLQKEEESTLLRRSPLSSK